MNKNPWINDSRQSLLDRLIEHLWAVQNFLKRVNTEREMWLKLLSMTEHTINGRHGYNTLNH
jgi:hypothetical protein